jgi:FecR protein
MVLCPIHPGGVNPISRFIHLGVFLLWLASGGFAGASNSSEPPGRVVYLQYLAGEVSVQPNGIGAWIQGSIFRPLTNADNVWADKDSRAELNLVSGRMRIDSETSLTLTKVTDRSVQVDLHQGVLNVHVRRLGDGEIYEIDTPNLAFTLTKAGDYRVDVSPNEDSTIVTVRQGEGQAAGHERTVGVQAGERTEFVGSSLEHPVRQAPRQDGFDEWCQDRDRRLDHVASASYPSPSPVNDDDVEQYRAWREAYGPVWVPTTVAPVWVPYRSAYWIWVNP